LQAALGGAQTEMRRDHAHRRPPTSRSTSIALRGSRRNAQVDAADVEHGMAGEEDIAVLARWRSNVGAATTPKPVAAARYSN